MIIVISSETFSKREVNKATAKEEWRGPVLCRMTSLRRDGTQVESSEWSRCKLEVQSHWSSAEKPIKLLLSHWFLWGKHVSWFRVVTGLKPCYFAEDLWSELESSQLDDIYMLSGIGLDFPESSMRAAGLAFKGNVGKIEILVNVTAISCVMPRTMDSDWRWPRFRSYELNYVIFLPGVITMQYNLVGIIVEIFRINYLCCMADTNLNARCAWLKFI